MKRPLTTTLCVMALFLTGVLWAPNRVSGSRMPAGPQQGRKLDRDKPNAPAGENRVALVIGNAAYRSARKLDNPANDARAMARALREVGFDVLGPAEGYLNLDKREMVAAVKEFGRRLEASPGVGLFYFAGHGVEANGTNYLIPVDAAPDDETDLLDQGLDIQRILDKFVGNRLNIVILDACRDNPFARSFKRSRSGGGEGLKQVEAPTGTLIAYATAPRQTASDGTGVNGLYTEELLEAIRIRGLSIESVFKRVRVNVQKKSNGAQIPWENSSLNGDFYFIPEGSGSTASAPPVENDPPPVVTRQKRFGTLVVTASQPGIEVFIDGKSQGVSETRGETFRIDKLMAGRVVEVTGRLKGRDPVVKRVEIEPNREVQMGVEFGLAPSFTNVAGVEMVHVPQGSFVMGSEQADEERWTKNVFAKFGAKVNFNSNERPSRKVAISRPFYMGRYEVTQRQWRYVAEKLPKVKRDLVASPATFRGDDLPVESVSWEDCEEFILRLNGLVDGNEYALPTEAEWEYACRAGTTGDYVADLDSMGWYANNSGRSPVDAYQAFYGDARQDFGKYFENVLKPNGCQPHPVGRKSPNAFGLYDMHGNVWEWCADRYDETYYSNGPAVDPTGPSSGDKRILRGGSWDGYAHYCRSARRNWSAPAGRSYDMGFRVMARSSRS